MADYGVYLTTTDGRPFITPETTPVSLLGKYTASGDGVATAVITIDPSVINIPFVLSDAPAVHSVGYSGTQMTVRSSRQDSTGGAVNMQLYVFSIKAPTLPKWGVAIWNAAGKCILTNETRVLRDIVTIGTKGDPGTSGTSINQTRAGKWAIMPELAGNLAGVINQSPFSIPQIFFSRYDGTNTQISSVLATTPPTGGQGTTTSAQSSVKAIDASLYD